MAAAAAARMAAEGSIKRPRQDAHVCSRGKGGAGRGANKHLLHGVSRHHCTRCCVICHTYPDALTPVGPAAGSAAACRERPAGRFCCPAPAAECRQGWAWPAVRAAPWQRPGAATTTAARAGQENARHSTHVHPQVPKHRTDDSTAGKPANCFCNGHPLQICLCFIACVIMRFQCWCSEHTL